VKDRYRRKYECTKCAERKTWKHFPRDRSKRDGIRLICKKCHCRDQVAYFKRTQPARQAYARAWYARNKERAHKRGNESRLRRRARDPIGFMVQRIKVSAKARGLAFNLTSRDLRMPNKCPVFGLKLVWPKRLGHRRPPNMPTIDRVNSRRGYVRGNVQIISSRANGLKSNATLGELKALVRYIERANRGEL
jgi:hypothetical protein